MGIRDMHKGEAELTPETLRVYNAILDYWEEYTIPPTLDDLATRLTKSKTAVKWHIAKLAQLRMVVMTPRIRRSIRPVGMTITLPEEA